MTASPDLFTWLRGLKAGNWPGRDAAYAHPAQVRLWPLALDVIEVADALPDEELPIELHIALDAWFKAAEKERA